MTTVSSGWITIQALISPAAAVSGLQGCVPSVAARLRPGMATPKAKPPVAVSAVTTNCRRESALCERSGLRMMLFPISSLHQRGGAMDGAAQPLVGAAAADIGEIGVDVGIGRIRIALEIGRNRHDLSGLAVAALRHVLGEPSLLHRM